MQPKAATSPHFSSPRESLPSPPSTVNTPRSEKYPQNSIDNPNYERFPSPPPGLMNDVEDSKKHFKPVKIETPLTDGTRVVSPRSSESGRRHKKSISPKLESSSPGTRTLDRPTSAKKTEVARVAPTQVKTNLWFLTSTFFKNLFVIIKRLEEEATSFSCCEQICNSSSSLQIRFSLGER